MYFWIYFVMCKLGHKLDISHLIVIACSVEFYGLPHFYFLTNTRIRLEVSHFGLHSLFRHEFKAKIKCELAIFEIGTTAHILQNWNMCWTSHHTTHTIYRNIVCNFITESKPVFQMVQNFYRFQYSNFRLQYFNKQRSIKKNWIYIVIVNKLTLLM